MQRMPGKEPGHQCTAPPRPGHAKQNQEEQNSVGGVKGDIGQVVRLGIQAPKMDVRHVRNPSHWVPVTRPGMAKGPDYSLQGYAVLEMGILRDIVFIIEINELIMGHRTVQGEGNQREATAD